MIARDEDVTAALASPALSVALPDAPGGEASRLQARMARFSDGALHAHRRALLETVLPDAHGLEAAAAGRTTALLGGRAAGRFDVMPLARTIPVWTLSSALGVAPARLEEVVTATSRLCDALAPSLRPGPADEDADLAAAELTGVLEPLGHEEHVAAGVGVLFQARDATAALIGGALLAEGAEPDGDPGPRIERALRHEAPVQCTRRIAVADLVVGGVPVPRGAAVWVMLAAAKRSPSAPPATFGAGPHACPGAALAVALARGVIASLHANGWRPVPGQSVAYEPRPNLRLPARVLVEGR